MKTLFAIRLRVIFAACILQVVVVLAGGVQSYASAHSNWPKPRELQPFHLLYDGMLSVAWHDDDNYLYKVSYVLVINDMVIPESKIFGNSTIPYPEDAEAFLFSQRSEYSAQYRPWLAADSDSTWHIVRLGWPFASCTYSISGDRSRVLSVEDAATFKCGNMPLLVLPLRVAFIETMANAVVFVLIVYCAAVLVAMLRFCLRVSKGLCPYCKYDLCGTYQQKCAECGRCMVQRGTLGGDVA